MIDFFRHILTKDKTSRMLYIHDNKEKVNKISNRIGLLSIGICVTCMIFVVSPIHVSEFIKSLVLIFGWGCAGIDTRFLAYIDSIDKKYTEYKHKDEETAFNMLHKQCINSLNDIYNIEIEMLSKTDHMSIYYQDIKDIKAQLNNCEWVDDLQKIQHKLVKLLLSINIEYNLEKETKANNFKDKYWDNNKNDGSYKFSDFSSNYDLSKYLNILELPGNIRDMDLIKKQWKKLMMEYHPDKTHDNGEKAKDINAAYQELKKILG